eukprot:6126950-Amphidinium_carterae.1
MGEASGECTQGRPTRRLARGPQTGHMSMSVWVTSAPVHVRLLVFCKVQNIRLVFVLPLGGFNFLRPITFYSQVDVVNATNVKASESLSLSRSA